MAAASTADAGINRNISESSLTTLIISNNS